MRKGKRGWAEDLTQGIESALKKDFPVEIILHHDDQVSVAEKGLKKRARSMKRPYDHVAFRVLSESERVLLPIGTIRKRPT